MTSYRALVARAVEAVTLHPPTGYSWFGTRFDDLPAAIAAAMTPDDARQYVLYGLQAQLYADFYCPGHATQRFDAPVPALLPRQSQFVHLLSAANSGRGSRETGWVLIGPDDTSLVLEKDGLRVWARPDQVLDVGGDEPLPGARVSVRLSKELLKLSPGFYMALGDEGLDDDAGDPIVRFYWNLKPTAAPRLMASATTRLNRAGIAFRLKVVNDPERFTRCDAGVLYVRKEDYREAALIVADVHAEVSADLKSPTPALTRRLAPGLGLAEEPSSGESFGMHRCRLLAEGILRAHEAGLRRVEDRLEAIAEHWEDAGIDLEAPFLNPGSADDYTFVLSGNGPLVR